MINGIGDVKAGRVDGLRSGIEASASAARTQDGQKRPRTEAPLSAAAEMVSQGPPVDSEKVQMIRTAIAEGRYPVDPDKIAERMIELGFAP